MFVDEVKEYMVILLTYKLKTFESVYYQNMIIILVDWTKSSYAIEVNTDYIISHFVRIVGNDDALERINTFFRFYLSLSYIQGYAIIVDASFLLFDSPSPHLFFSLRHRQTVLTIEFSALYVAISSAVLALYIVQSNDSSDYKIFSSTTMMNVSINRFSFPVHQYILQWSLIVLGLVALSSVTLAEK